MYVLYQMKKVEELDEGESANTIADTNMTYFWGLVDFNETVKNDE